MQPRSSRLISVLISSALLLPIGAPFASGSEIPEVPHGPNPGEIDSQNPNVEIPDPVLRAKVEEQLNFLTGHTLGDPITKTDLRRLPLLFINTPDLTSLEGLQYATNLVALGIDNNSFTDLTPIKNLTKLQQLSLANTGLTDLDAVTNLKNLTSLNVSNNKISDFSALKNLPELTSLDATGQTLELTETSAGVAYPLPVVKTAGGLGIPVTVAEGSAIDATLVENKIIWHAGGIGKINWNHTLSPSFRISVTATQMVNAEQGQTDSDGGSTDAVDPVGSTDQIDLVDSVDLADPDDTVEPTDPAGTVDAVDVSDAVSHSDQSPQAPTINRITTKSNSKSATITWDEAPAENQAVAYVLTYVEVSNSKGAVKSAVRKQVAVNSKRLGHTLNDLNPGSVYRVHLRTRDSEGNVSPATSVFYTHPQITKK